MGHAEGIWEEDRIIERKEGALIGVIIPIVTLCGQENDATIIEAKLMAQVRSQGETKLWQNLVMSSEG